MPEKTLTLNATSPDGAFHARFHVTESQNKQTKMKQEKQKKQPVIPTPEQKKEIEQMDVTSKDVIKGFMKDGVLFEEAKQEALDWAAVL